MAGADRAVAQGEVTIPEVAGGEEESDYDPYGGEIPISGSDPNHYKFTGEEQMTHEGC